MGCEKIFTRNYRRVAVFHAAVAEALCRIPTSERAYSFVINATFYIGLDAICA